MTESGQAFFRRRSLELRSGLLKTKKPRAPLRPSQDQEALSSAQAFSRPRSLELRSGLLGLPEDLGDLVDLGQQLVGLRGVQLALGAGGAGELGGLVDQRVQLRVLLEVRWLEVVGPQDPEVVLHQLRALLLDQDRARAEVRVVVVRDLGDDGLDRLRLDAGLRRVVDTAGKVAVGGYLEGGGEQSREHAGPLVFGCRSVRDCDTTPRATASGRRVLGYGTGTPVGI